MTLGLAPGPNAFHLLEIAVHYISENILASLFYFSAVIAI